jgi:hypothetical protein
VPESSKKLSGVSDEDARRSTVASGTNLAGLVQHVTFVESKWFGGLVAGGTPRRGRRSMEVDPSVSLRAFRSEYRAACDASNQIATALVTADAPHNGSTRSLRWAMLAVTQETARATPATRTSSANKSTVKRVAEPVPAATQDLLLARGRVSARDRGTSRTPVDSAIRRLS